VFATTAGVLSALSSESAYLNVHTTTYGAGEIRGQFAGPASWELTTSAYRDTLLSWSSAWVVL
jgi:hypothetical protein